MVVNIFSKYIRNNNTFQKDDCNIDIEKYPYKIVTTMNNFLDNHLIFSTIVSVSNYLFNPDRYDNNFNLNENEK